MLILAENVSNAMTGKKFVVKKDRLSLLMALMLMAQLRRVDILATSLSMKGKYFCDFCLCSYTFCLFCYTSRNLEMNYP